MKYLVRVAAYWDHVIEADTPEDAAQIFADGEAPAGECTGYAIEAVTHEGDLFGDDLRADRPCRGGCGKMIPASRNDECPQCLLLRLDAESV